MTFREVVRIGGLTVVLIMLTLALVGPASGHGAMMHADVHWLSDESPVPGASATLTTNNAGATMAFHTNSLEAGPYTAWWIIWNQPDNCSAPGCGFDDLFNEGAGFSAVFATGHVVGRSGQAQFGAHLSTDDASGSIFGPGLLEPTTAEIHVVIRSHGDLDPSKVVEQIHTVEFDCDPAVCVDLQGAAFQQ